MATPNSSTPAPPSTTLLLNKVVPTFTPPLTLSNLAHFVVALMQSAEEWQQLNGEQRKQLVLQAIDQYIDNQPSSTMTADEKLLLKRAVNCLPAFIDFIISASKNRLFLNQSCSNSRCCAWF